MNAIPVTDTNSFVNEFLQEYLSDGIGAKNKREIDILIMNLLMKYADLANKSNQELSILLQAPVAKIKSLRYEARLKYPPEPDYAKKEFLIVLQKSQYDMSKGKIIFAIEDDFLRHILQGKLKEKGYFADSSFNTELVKIDKMALEAVIEELYGQETAADFQNGFDEMEKQLEGGDIDIGKAFSKTIFDFASSTAAKFAFEFMKKGAGF
jgi:hypothetical protein